MTFPGLSSSFCIVLVKLCFRPASGTTQCHYPDSAANDQEVADDLAGKGFTGDERPEGLTPMVAAAWHESTTHDTTYRTPR